MTKDIEPADRNAAGEPQFVANANSRAGLMLIVGFIVVLAVLLGVEVLRRM
jgi:hypothetical protein